MKLHDVTVPYVDRSLASMERWIDVAHAFAGTKKVDPETMLDARLAIDQFPLKHQITSASDAGKLLCFRCADREAPKHPDDVKTWAELRARIADVRRLVRELPTEFDESRVISLPFFAPKQLRIGDYALAWGLPNFSFHVVTTYAIFRHLGVELGKQDFVGPLPFLEA